MESIKSYILSVIIAALIVSILLSVVNTKSPYYKILKTIGGLVVLIVIISPWKNLQINNFDSFYSDYKTNAQYETEYGKSIADQSLRQIIKEQTESYILDKAESLDATIQVSVILKDDTYPTPISATLTGNISPYAKNRLSHIIYEDLGIPEDKQTWN